MDNYFFLREIAEFDIESFLPHLGWIGPQLNPIKIYTKDGAPNFFLHDETKDQLFEFESKDPAMLKNRTEYDKVVHLYRKTFDK